MMTIQMMMMIIITTICDNDPDESRLTSRPLGVVSIRNERKKALNRTIYMVHRTGAYPPLP
jgi:hypothetical protein